MNIYILQSNIYKNLLFTISVTIIIIYFLIEYKLILTLQKWIKKLLNKMLKTP